MDGCDANHFAALLFYALTGRGVFLLFENVQAGEHPACSIS